MGALPGDVGLPWGCIFACVAGAGCRMGGCQGDGSHGTPAMQRELDTNGAKRTVPLVKRTVPLVPFLPFFRSPYSELSF